MIKDVYDKCPIYKKNSITLRQTTIDDAGELLSCYSDKKSLPFFNADNCNGDDFHYTTIERMKQTIDFWNSSYENRDFVRWTVIFNNNKIGTIEMFHRVADDEFNHYGILRIDLQSKFETKHIINKILEITNENFYKDFNVNAILTKAVPGAIERISSLKNNGFQPLESKFMKYDDYFICHN